MMYIPELDKSVRVDGWSSMIEVKRTKNRAFTLQAMANLEVRMFTKGGPPPTQETIMQEAIRLGATLSPKSIQQISRNIHKLIEDGHVIYVADEEERPERGRGGPTSPWRTQYIYPLVKNLLRNSNHTK